MAPPFTGGARVDLAYRSIPPSRARKHGRV